MFHAMVRFTLILLLQLRMLAGGLIISRRFVQVRTSPKHWSTHISNYHSTEHELSQHDESDQMKFSCTLKNTLLIIRNRFGLSFASKGLGYLAALFFYYRYLLITNYLAIKLLCYLQFSTCRHYLAENHLSFPFVPRWVRHSYLSKRATIDTLYLWIITCWINKARTSSS